MKSSGCFKQQSKLLHQIFGNLLTALLHQIKNRIGNQPVMRKAIGFSSGDFQHRFINKGLWKGGMGIIDRLCLKDSIRNGQIIVGILQLCLDIRTGESTSKLLQIEIYFIPAQLSDFLHDALCSIFGYIQLLHVHHSIPPDCHFPGFRKCKS